MHLAVLAVFWPITSLLILLSGPAPARAQSQPTVPAAPGSFQVLAEQIGTLFPVVHTEVVETADEQVTIAAGSAAGVRRGLELVVYREGRELYHPTTKKLLGRVEETLGRLVVHSVHETYSVARLTSRAPDRAIQAGDKARTSGEKPRLTVVGLSSGVSPALTSAASDALVREVDRTGRVQVVFGDRITLWLSEQRITPEEFMQGKGMGTITERFQAPHVLAVHYTLVQGKPFMTARLFARGVESPVLQQGLVVPPSVKPPVAQPYSTGGTGNVTAARRSLLERLLSGDWQPNAYSASAASIPIRVLATLPFTVTSAEVAVSPTDSVPRIVLTDGQRVFLYRIAGDKLEPEWTHDKLMLGSILSVQFADLNGDGVLDVVVNRQDIRVGMLSYILTSREGRPHVLVKDIPLILMALDENGDGTPRSLWAHPQEPTTFFTRGVATRYVLKGDDLAQDRHVPVNDAFRLTGATFADLGQAGRVLAFIDEQNRLKITSNAQELWRSLTVVGGGLAQALFQVPVGRTMVDKFVKMEPRPLAVDLDGDKVQEIVVPVNATESGQLAVVFRGPAGYRIQVLSSGFEGFVTALGAIPGDGTPTLVAAVVRRTGVWRTPGETQIIVTVPE